MLSYCFLALLVQLKYARPWRREHKLRKGGKIMYLNRQNLYAISKGHYDHARARIIYHLKWNILPVAVMLILLGWVSLQAGKMIDESKLSTGESVGVIE